jgi:glycosyltransferase involved in cell wall biosynthesis
MQTASAHSQKGADGRPGIRVLHVCETAIGGIGTYLNHLGRMAEPGLEQRFLVPSAHLHAIDSGLAVAAYPSKARGPRAWLSMLAALRRTLRASPSDIVFFHSTFALLGLMAVKALGHRGRTVYCAHGWAASKYSGAPLKLLLVRAVEGTLCGLADVVVNVSQADAETARRLGYLGKHKVIENAVPDASADARDDLFADEPGALHLLFVGRLDRQKGLDILLEAFGRARQRRRDLRLHIVGTAVRKDAAAITLPEGATLAGWIDPTHVDDWYRSADALLVPSRWEGFGLVVPESLRNGTPVLCSDRGALPGLVEPGETGAVFPLEVDALSKLLAGLKRGELRSMREASRKRFETRFHVSRLHAELVALFRDISRSDADERIPILADHIEHLPSTE